MARGRDRDEDAGIAPIAVSMGDPCGIGLDITIAAWLQRETRHLPPFVIWADARSVRDRAAVLGVDAPCRTLPHEGQGASIFAFALPIIDIPLGESVQAGQPDPRYASGVIAAMSGATQSVVSGRSRALLTNPIAKSVLYSAGFEHPGHTEYLAAFAHQATGRATHPVMMLAAGDLRVVPLTVHVPLADVPSLIGRDLLSRTVETVADALRRDFGIQKPRIAVSGLNPHAGEDGALGREEIDTIAPAIAKLAASGLDVTGPVPADTLFHPAARRGYDVAITMYHDQGLAPFKAIAFDTGVNVTLGLPFVRTSPDHGTAFSLAGTGKASPESFISALQLADALARRRQLS